MNTIVYIGEYIMLKKKSYMNRTSLISEGFFQKIALWWEIGKSDRLKKSIEKLKIKEKSQKQKMVQSLDKLNKGWKEFDEAFEKITGEKPGKKKNLTIDSFLDSLEKGKDK